MKYKFESIRIDGLEKGDIVDIPDNSLILNCITNITNTLESIANSRVGITTEPKYVTYINTLVPLKEE